MTDEQKIEIKDFFKSHSNIESKFLDGKWNSDFQYSDFKYFKDYYDSEAKTDRKVTKELRKSNGLKSLTEGIDYRILEDNNEFTAYFIRTHKGARVIASNMIEPKLWCESVYMTWNDKQILPKDEPMKGDLYQELNGVLLQYIEVHGVCIPII